MLQVLRMIHKELSVKLLEKDALKRNKLFYLICALLVSWIKVEEKQMSGICI